MAHGQTSRYPPGGPANEGAGTGAGRGTRQLDRRRFLALAGGVGTAGVLAAALGPRAFDALFATPSAGTQAAGSPGGKAAKPTTLVLLTLYGGNDGLNTVIPYEDPAYEASRGLLAIPPASVLPLGDGLGLHPQMPGFKKLWDAGQLAVVQGVGFADPNYSHFESMDIWQSAVPGTPVSSGWLGRWLDATTTNPMQAVGIGPTLPTALTGVKMQGAAIEPGPLVLPGGPAEQALYATLAGTAAGEAALLAASASSGADLLRVEQQIGPILRRTAGSDPLGLASSGSSGAAGDGAALAISDGGGGQASAGVLALQLSVVANLILAGVTTPVYSVELGGFDTHTNQLETQAALLGEIDAAVTAFVDAVGTSERGKGVVVVMYTEFGRCVSANASAGTDHGWANQVFVAGPAVRGGFFGEPASLSKLSNDSTIYTTDFRSVYATIFDGVLGVDSKGFLQGSFPTLTFL
jgi:uncharacterized protein (DUF1501 family)